MAVLPITPLPAPAVCNNNCSPWLGPQGDSITCVPKAGAATGVKLCGTYVGTGEAQDIVVGFDPDLVMWKTNTDTPHLDNWMMQSTEFLDQTHVLRPDIGSARMIMSEFITSFIVPGGGFRLGTGLPTGGNTSIPHANYPGVTYTYYAFKKAAGFFDCGIYVGTGVDPGIHAHSLTVVPELIIAKPYNTTRSWAVYHKDMGELNAGFYDSPIPTFVPPVSANSSIWGRTPPTDLGFATGDAWNLLIDNFYMMFSSIEGVCKVGSFVSDGSVQIIPVDFIPAQLLIKNAFNSNPWRWVDICNNPSNPATKHLNPCESTFLETTLDICQFQLDRVEIVSTDADYNQVGDTYVYVILGY